MPPQLRCTIDRDLYMYHHWRGKPRALRGLHGCALYAADARFHRGIDGSRPTARGELIESIAVVLPSVSALEHPRT
jgi:hypothetical protein